MLRFCYRMLPQKDPPLPDQQVYVYLEAFLLHYRNLIEFFGGHRTGLNVKEWKAWTNGRTLTDEEVTRIFDRLPYQHKSPISRYLQHITPNRAEMDRVWDVDEMYQEIEQLLLNFEDLFPRAM